MVMVVHLSDIHTGAWAFREDLLLDAIERINQLGPDATIVTGDLSENGYHLELEKAAEYLDCIKTPMLVVPGNHDARHLGNRSYEELIKERYGTLKVKNKGLEIIGLDSSEPDLNYGKVGRAQQIWMENELDKASSKGLFKIIALHHHIIPVPRTGRERNVLSDAGDILMSLIDKNADLVLSGHKHVPHAWMVHDTVFATAGTVSSLKLRGKDLPSFNTININDDYIEILLNNSNGDKISLGKYENKCR